MPKAATSSPGMPICGAASTPPGEGPGLTPAPETPAELLGNALNALGKPIREVEAAVKEVEAVESDDGTPAIESLGADQAGLRRLAGDPLRGPAEATYLERAGASSGTARLTTSSTSTSTRTTTTTSTTMTDHDDEDARRHRGHLDLRCPARATSGGALSPSRGNVGNATRTTWSHPPRHSRRREATPGYERLLTRTLRTRYALGPAHGPLPLAPHRALPGRHAKRVRRDRPAHPSPIRRPEHRPRAGAQHPMGSPLFFAGRERELRDLIRHADRGPSTVSSAGRVPRNGPRRSSTPTRASRTTWSRPLHRVPSPPGLPGACPASRRA